MRGENATGISAGSCEGPKGRAGAGSGDWGRRFADRGVARKLESASAQVEYGMQLLSDNHDSEEPEVTEFTMSLLESGDPEVCLPVRDRMGGR